MNGEKYQVGDKVACLPGFDYNTGGAGYTEGYVGVVTRITESQAKPENVVYWFNDAKSDCGIYGRALTLWKPEVINDYPIY